MTLPIEIVSEPLPREGGHIQGASPLKGELGLAALLVRETVQNSWDARDPRRGDRPVNYRLDGRTLQGSSLDALRTLLPFGTYGGQDSLPGFSGPGREGSIMAPESFLGPDRKRLEVLVVSDRQTVGLCGGERGGRSWRNPKRLGDEWPEGVQRFANFVRNTGRAESDIGEGDGGSFGVGKTVLWRTSRCGTILVHTRTTDANGDPVDRVIGIVHGASWEDEDLQYSGRHFIGLRDDRDDHYVAPLTGEDARRVVDDLGLPPYGDGFGTSVVVIAPRYDEDSDLKSAMLRLRDAARWHVWPKIVNQIRPHTELADMDIRLTAGGEELAIPDPDRDSELQPYATALRDALIGQSKGVFEGDPPLDHPARYAKHDKELGWLRIREAVGENNWNTTVEISRKDEETSVVPFEKPHNRVALIRREPLLLVRYEDLPDMSAGSTYGGVYLSAEDSEVEHALTLSEPPAHNAWHPQAPELSHREATLVRFSIRDLRKGIREFRKAFLPEIRSTPAHELSKRIGSGIGGHGGKGGRRKPPVIKDRPSQPRKPSAVLTPMQPGLDPQGRTVHRINVSLELVETGARVRLRARAVGKDSAGTLDVDDRISIGWVALPDVAADVQGSILTTLVPDATSPVGQLQIVLQGDLRLQPGVAVEVVDG